MYSPLDEAMYKTVHEYGTTKSGGAVKLSQLVGMNPGTLSNKVNPGMDTHKLTVSEAVAIQHTTKDFRILYAIATILDHVCIPVPDFNNVSDVELLNAYSKLHVEIGQLAHAINDALEDKKISRKEFLNIQKEGTEAVQAYYELLCRLESLIDE